MHDKGDIPEREEVKPGNVTDVTSGTGKIKLVDEIIANGGVAHVYLDSINRAPEEDEVEAEDVHVHDFNSYRMTDVGLLYVLVGDEEMWIPGDDIGSIERHYE